MANPSTAAADASAEEDLRPTTTTLAPWTRTSRRPQTVDPERREPMHRLVHAAVELHVLPGLAERGPEDEKEEAQAHPERGRVLEAIQ